MGICNFQDISYNSIGATDKNGPTAEEDASMGIIQCKNVQPVSTFSSYKPYTGMTGLGVTSGISHLTSSIGTRVSVPNKTVLDASCCYIYTPSGDTQVTPYSKCSDVTFDISGSDISGRLVTVGSITISNEGINNGAKLEICARSIGQSAQALGGKIKDIGKNLTGSISNIASEGKTMGGINGFVLLVISGLLSLFVYVLFMLGPFMFWTKFAPNTLIVGENECHQGRTVLDRHFSYERNQLPYNWKKYDVCKPPSKNRPIILDKCMNDINTDVLQSKIKVGGSSVFDKIDFLFRGFPYNLIDTDKEIFYKCYTGGFALLATIGLCSLIWLTMYHTSDIFKNGFGFNVKGDVEILLPILINCLVGAGLTYFILTVIMKRQVQASNKSFIIVPVIIVFITMALSILPKTKIIRTILAGIASVCIFIYIAALSSKPSVDGKNYSFSGAIVKTLYYIRKTLVLEFQGLNMEGNHTFSNYFKFIGNLPIPGWIITIFGPALLPILIFPGFFFTLLSMIKGGLVGALDWLEPIIPKTSKCFYTGKSSKNKKMKGGGSDTDNLDNHSDNHSDNDEEHEGGGRKIKFNKERFKEINKDGLSGVNKKGVGIFINYRNKLKKKIERRKQLGGFQNPAYGLLLTFFLVTVVCLVLYLAWCLPVVLVKYFLIPLLYPKIMVNIISCNIKSLIFVLISGILGIMWHPKNQNKYVPKEALLWMTVTFGVITLFNILSK